MQEVSQKEAAQNRTFIKHNLQKTGRALMKHRNKIRTNREDKFSILTPLYKGQDKKNRQKEV